jgi:membrane protein implicated in regulation of membrane protease activity
MKNNKYTMIFFVSLIVLMSFGLLGVFLSVVFHILGLLVHIIAVVIVLMVVLAVVGVMQFRRAMSKYAKRQEGYLADPANQIHFSFTATNTNEREM